MDEEHVSTGDQLADINKTSRRVKFMEIRERIGLQAVKKKAQD